MKKKKAFDSSINDERNFRAVEFMRTQRDRLSDMYNNRPDQFQLLLNEAINTYKGKFHKMRKTAV